tara:strand:+ start:244 stop:675 length:432 start_codon:yes stop_codon:yes gene_type:complete
MDKIHTIARAYIRDKDSLLLAHNGNNFFLPGGHVKYNEPLLTALKREIKEELDLEDVKIGGFFGVVENVWDNKGSPFHEQCFIFEIFSSLLSSDIPVISKEPHITFHWGLITHLQNDNFLPRGINDFLENYSRTHEARFYSSF